MVAATEIYIPMQAAEARQITTDIRLHLREAREKLLRLYNEHGWEALGYESFQEYAIAEFDVSWQQVYRILGAAQVDDNLKSLSPEGESKPVKINHAKQLNKLKSPENQLRAFTMAQTQASAQGMDEPTESIVASAVQVIQAEEVVLQSEYHVLKQIFAAGEVTAADAKRMKDDLDKLNDDAAIAYVQSLLARGLKNPDLVFPIGWKYFNERKNNKPSKTLDTIDRSGTIGNTPLHKASLNDWYRAINEAKNEHIAEEEAERIQRKMLEGEIVPIQIVVNLWKHAPIKTAKVLVEKLPQADLEAAFGLLAEYLGYVGGDGKVKFGEGDYYTLQPNYDFGLDADGNHEIDILVRPKKEEEKGEEDESHQS